MKASNSRQIIANCSHLSFSYKKGGENVLKNISFSIEMGSQLAIVGPNGGGKSTLLKVLAGFLKPRSGSVTLNAPVSYLPQLHSLDRYFPFAVKDILEMGLYGQKSIDKQRKIKEALDEVGLSGFENRFLDQLSGGQFQRVLFARLILQNRPFILLDEPFTGIDTKTMYDLAMIINRWHDEGRTIISVLHDLNFVKQCFPQTLLLNHAIVAMGETPRVLTMDNMAKAFFGGPQDAL